MAKLDLWWPLVTYPLTWSKKWPEQFRHDFLCSFECRLPRVAIWPRSRVRGAWSNTPGPARSAPSTAPAWANNRDFLQCNILRSKICDSIACFSICCHESMNFAREMSTFLYWSHLVSFPECIPERRDTEGSFSLTCIESQHQASNNKEDVSIVHAPF